MSYITLRSNSLIVASRTGRLDDVKVALQKGANVDSRESMGNTALILATQNGHVEIVKLLLSFRADVNGRGLVEMWDTVKPNQTITPIRLGRVRVTPLHLAVGLKNNPRIGALLCYGVVEDLRSRNISPLTSTGDVEMVRALLEAGADTEVRMGYDTGKSHLLSEEPESGTLYTAIHLAVLCNQTAIVRLLLEYHASATVRTPLGNTFLDLAVVEGHADVVKLLLASNPDIDTFVNGAVEIDRVKPTPLHRAVEDGREDIALLLLSHGARILNLKKGSPLHVAAENGNEAMARLLLKHRADIDQTTPVKKVANPFLATAADVTQGGASPLRLAAATGHLGMVQLLLQRGAAVEVMSFPKRCLHHECFFRSSKVLACSAVHIAAAHGHQKVVKLLINLGSKVDAWIHFWYESTVWKGGLFHLAVVRLDLQALYLFHKLGVNVNQKDSHDRTALHMTTEARERGKSPLILNTLLGMGADVDARDKRHRSALHLATTRQELGMIDRLLRAGARVNVRDSDDQTPLHYASHLSDHTFWHSLIYNHLLQSGADEQIPDKYGDTPRQLKNGWSRPLLEEFEELLPSDH